MRNKKLSLRIIVQYLLILFFTLTSLTTHSKKIALSFDDGLNPQFKSQALIINQNILDQLKKHQIQTIIFPSLIKIGDYQGKQIIEKWGKSGHIIGNHSALHQNLNHANVSVSSYIQSIRDAETILKTLTNFQLIYRYPFLKEGDTLDKRDQVRHWLIQNNYQNGGVSIDASDWFYNLKFQQYSQIKSSDKIQRLKKAYLSHLLNRAEYYEQLAIKTLQRSPKHVLLLHVNQINAAFLDEVIQNFQNNGWTMISAKEAFQDPLYQQFSQNIPAGESIIWSIAKSQGLENLRYPAEDAPYEIENIQNFGLD
ncbi:MAG: polysaccharide deacetylase family protein [Candidatus Acinetobacter avistercoris]|uniref:polysaccharide deacetylase family protein n=1 Tax=Acinetobacter sp. KS-LM10 TaxID=3120518 RepID=UPI001F9F2EE8|nr:polysaccharide deacetylase family protein [Candidatus Acinetobacter avistercoris]